MKRMTNSALVGALALILMMSVSASAQKPNGENKNKYKDVEVANFDVKEGVAFPADWMKPMMDEIIAKLKGLGRFRHVLSAGETPPDATMPTIQLVGTVTKYEPGSRAKRYVISMGAGKTRITTHVKFLDKATGNLLYETDATGAVSWGLFGGDSKSSLSGVGKKVAEVAKREFF